MENIISEREHKIPINRVVMLDKEKVQIDGHKTYVTIKKPSGHEDQSFEVSTRNNSPCVTVPRSPGGRWLRTNTVTLKIWQYNNESAESPVMEKAKEPEIAPVLKNPEPIKKNKRPKVTEAFKNLPIVRDFIGDAIAKSEEREAMIAAKRNEVVKSIALKPVGLDGKTILTADDCDYSRGVAIIENLIKGERLHNKGAQSLSQKKLLCEFYDLISFAGSSTVIGLNIALGDKALENGNLEAFLSWYQKELSKVYSPTSIGAIADKGRKFVNGMKPKKFRKNPNPGFSIKQVEKIVGALFTNPNSGEPYRMKDLHCEVYQPLFLDDERTRVYSKAATPNARLVDVVINTALDPNYFQTRKIEDMGISLGPVRRSFDLPIAQHNKDIELVSLGAELTYQESEEDLEGVTPAQISFLNKRKVYRLDYEDTEKYVTDNSQKVRFMRIQSPQLPGVPENSILMNHLIKCRTSAKDTKIWTNGNKTALTWG